MKFATSFSVLLLSGGLSCASSLAVYQDKTFYNFSPKNSFIGFTQGVKAKCEGRTMALVTKTSCSQEDRLCQLLIGLKNSQQELQVVQASTVVLTQLISLPRPSTLDAPAWIESSKLIAQEQSKLYTQEKLLNDEVFVKQKEFEEQAPSKQVQQVTQGCSKELELSIPYGYVSFSTEYEADIEDEKEITVTQHLSVTNRSGIDIEADTATFYYRSVSQYVYPVHFSPWIVSIYEQRPQAVYEKSMRKEVASAMPMVSMAQTEDLDTNSQSEPVALYEDAREYKIQNLNLPSTGAPLSVPVITWKAPLSCEVRAYPYENTKAFHVCSFVPKYQIDSKQWKVKSANEVINENATGEYRKDTYNLYIKVEEDIQIQRKPIVNKERESGIFGGTVRKKDGFTLVVINKSDKSKTLKIAERIPTSTNEEIKSKLFSVNSENNVDYKMLKDGEIEINLVLAANENKKIEVLFELSYDKDLEANY